MLIILFVSFVILLLIGAPIAYSMGFSSLLALILSGSTFPLEVVVQRSAICLATWRRSQSSPACSSPEYPAPRSPMLRRSAA